LRLRPFDVLEVRDPPELLAQPGRIPGEEPDEGLSLLLLDERRAIPNARRARELAHALPLGKAEEALGRAALGTAIADLDDPPMPLGLLGRAVDGIRIPIAVPGETRDEGQFDPDLMRFARGQFGGEFTHREGRERGV